MSAILIHKVELSCCVNIDLDAEMLGWVDRLPMMGPDEMWLRHSHGLIGNLTGVFKLMIDLMPDATWSVIFTPGASAEASISFDGDVTAFRGTSADPANALLAAIMRAWSGRPAAAAVPLASDQHAEAAE